MATQLYIDKRVFKNSVPNDIVGLNNVLDLNAFINQEITDTFYPTGKMQNVSLASNVSITDTKVRCINVTTTGAGNITIATNSSIKIGETISFWGSEITTLTPGTFGITGATITYGAASYATLQLLPFCFFTVQKVTNTNYMIVSGGSTDAFSNAAVTVKIESSALSSANILALNTTPITLLPALPTTQFYNIINAVAVMKTGTTPYDITGVTGISLSTGEGTWGANILTTAPANRKGTLSTAPTVSNAAVTISAAGADPTAGNGTMKIHLTYTINKF